jgi:hypothetical protein
MSRLPCFKSKAYSTAAINDIWKDFRKKNGVTKE